jgi:hypothetical protein
MKLSEIIRYYRWRTFHWKTYRILFIQRRWNKLAAKGYCADHICARLGLTPLDYIESR